MVHTEVSLKDLKPHKIFLMYLKWLNFYELIKSLKSNEFLKFNFDQNDKRNLMLIIILNIKFQTGTLLN